MVANGGTLVLFRHTAWLGDYPRPRGLGVAAPRRQRQSGVSIDGPQRVVAMSGTKGFCTMIHTVMEPSCLGRNRVHGDCCWEFRSHGVFARLSKVLLLGMWFERVLLPHAPRLSKRNMLFGCGVGVDLVGASW